MKKLIVLAVLAVLCFGLTSCEQEIVCLYEVTCVDSSYDATWKILGNGYSGVCSALESAGFTEETTDMFSKKGAPSKLNSLVKQTIEAAVASNESGLLKGIAIQAKYYNDSSHPVVVTATYPGRPE